MTMKAIAKRFLSRLKGTKANDWPWPSETSKCRGRLAPFCSGYGVDIGFGGDPITAHAIRVDLSKPYTAVGQHSVQLGGNGQDLFWFRDGVLDFVYSSHLLEDFEDPKTILKEWLRVLKPGGKLILYCPDEQVFRRHCAATGQPTNPYHKHEWFCLEAIKRFLDEIGGVEILHEVPLVDIYSWELVCIKKTG